MAGDVASAALSVKNLPRLGAWLGDQLREPALLEHWAVLFVKLAGVLLAALLADRLVDRLTRGARERLDAFRANGANGAGAGSNGTASSMIVRSVALLIRTVLGLVPIVAFVGVAYLALALVEPDRTTQMATLAVIHANVLVRAILAIARLVLVQRETRYRVLELSEETAEYDYVWVRRLTAVAIYGFFLLQASRVMGLPPGTHGVALRILGLLLATMLVILVLQNRTLVADWLRGSSAQSGGVIGGIARRVADVWHILTILYIAAIFIVWALDVPGGFIYLARGTALTLLILLLARAANTLLRRAITRGFAIGGDMTERLPGLEARANRYLPVLNAVLRGAITLVALVALLQAWGADSFGWLGSDLGRRVLKGAMTVAIVIAISVLGWEMLASMIERYLSETDTRGNQVMRSARTRTLLPLLRNATMILLVVMVGLIVLSEIGVDIAPLLAGAGVIGLAIGFGAQTLVKDVITGLFILIEDTIHVGDVVTVDQRSGAVESISIRSIRIRDVEGAVYTVPFSAVSTVKNMTKGFSYYVFDVGVGAGADIDQAIALLRTIDQAVRAEAVFQGDILEPIDVLGVDKPIDGGVMIRARIKTRPGAQWRVGREFNRRIAIEFGAAAIPGAVPQRSVLMIAAATPAARPETPLSVVPKPASSGER